MRIDPSKGVSILFFGWKTAHLFLLVLYKSFFPSPVPVTGVFLAKRGFLKAFLGRTFHSHCQDHVHVIDMNLYDTWMDFLGTGDGVGGVVLFIRMGEGLNVVYYVDVR